MNNFYDFLGGRKLAFALIVTLIASVFVWFGKCTAADWVDFMKWVFGIYAGGNVGEYFGKAFTKK